MYSVYAKFYPISKKNYSWKIAIVVYLNKNKFHIAWRDKP